jgi:hypothetical protein
MISFGLDSKELKKFNEWNTEHKKKCSLKGSEGAIGGRLTFSFTPTGLGTITTIKCGCGEELDVTEYDW